MRLEIDVPNKTITVHDSLTLNELDSLFVPWCSLFPTEEINQDEWRLKTGDLKDFRPTPLIDLKQKSFPWEERCSYRVKQTRQGNGLYYIEL